MLTRERLEQLIARSSDIVVATDRGGIVVYYNDGAQRSLGYAPSEVIGAFVGQLYPNVAEAKRVMRAMRSSEYGGSGIVETFRTTFLSKAGCPGRQRIRGLTVARPRDPQPGVRGSSPHLLERSADLRWIRAEGS